MNNQLIKEQISQKMISIILEMNKFTKTQNIHTFYYISFGIIIKKFLDISKKYKICVPIDNDILKQLYNKLGFADCTFDDVKNNTSNFKETENLKEENELLNILNVLNKTEEVFENMDPQLMNEITSSLLEVGFCY